MVWKWPFKKLDRNSYKRKSHHGFATKALNAKYERLMMTCYFMFFFWLEVTAGLKYCKHKAGAAEKDEMKDSLHAAVPRYFVKYLSWLPKLGKKGGTRKCTSFGSVRDLVTNISKKMKKLKLDHGVPLNDWDKGYKRWHKLLKYTASYPRFFEPKSANTAISVHAEVMRIAHEATGLARTHPDYYDALRHHAHDELLRRDREEDNAPNERTRNILRAIRQSFREGKFEAISDI